MRIITREEDPSIELVEKIREGLAEATRNNDTVHHVELTSKEFELLKQIPVSMFSTLERQYNSIFGYPIKVVQFTAAQPQVPEGIVEKYNELLYHVASAFPDESRHETALRYIKQAESGEATQVAKGEGK